MERPFWDFWCVFALVLLGRWLSQMFPVHNLKLRAIKTPKWTVIWKGGKILDYTVDCDLDKLSFNHISPGYLSLTLPILTIFKLTRSTLRTASCIVWTYEVAYCCWYRTMPSPVNGRISTVSKNGYIYVHWQEKRNNIATAKEWKQKLRENSVEITKVVFFFFKESFAFSLLPTFYHRFYVFTKRDNSVDRKD